MRVNDAKLAELEALREKLKSPSPWAPTPSRDWSNALRRQEYANVVCEIAPDLIADLREANAAIELSQGVNQTYADGENAAVARAEKAEAELRELKAERDRLRDALASIRTFAHEPKHFVRALMEILMTAETALAKAAP